MNAPTDSLAIDTIAHIMSSPEDWDSDTLDAIAAVLDAVRTRGDQDPSTWVQNGPPLVWIGRRYVTDETAEKYLAGEICFCSPDTFHSCTPRYTAGGKPGRPE